MAASSAPLGAEVCVDAQLPDRQGREGEPLRARARSDHDRPSRADVPRRQRHAPCQSRRRPVALHLPLLRQLADVCPRPHPPEDLWGDAARRGPGVDLLGSDPGPGLIPAGGRPARRPEGRRCDRRPRHVRWRTRKSSGARRRGSIRALPRLPRGREAGESPAQSRYGDHALGVEVRSPVPRSMSDLREKGTGTMRPLPVRPVGFGARAARTATAAAVLALAACSPAATTRPSVPPDATGALVPPATATVPPSQAAVASPSPAFPVTLKDDEGTSITLAAEPQKIVSLTPAETEILYAIGAGDRVVGKVEDIANYPPEAKDVPVVSKFGTTGVDVDIEKIVSLGTDLVIAGGEGGTPQDAIDKLRSLKVPVLVVYAPDVAHDLDDVHLTGQAVGEVENAERLDETIKKGFEDVAKATDGVDKPRVFYETGDQPSIYGIADNSL